MIEKRKIYILYPPISKMERYSSKIGEAGGNQIPLGIYYLASYLRENNFCVKVTDAEAENLAIEDIITIVDEYSPDYIGISSTTVAFHRAIECAEEIKKNNKDIKIILGGPHITSNYNHAMSFDVFDYGVIGEGEVTLVALLNGLYENNDLHNISGVVYRDNEGNCKITSQREYINVLDTLPYPAYDLIKDIKLYNPPPSNYKALPIINMITSRGCPSQCTFCDRNVFGKKYRERSAESVFNEILFLYNKYKIKEIAFVDDTFLINKKRIYKLFDLLNREGLSFYWTCMSRINNVTYDFLKFIKDNGCWHISFGIESGDENILKTIKKNIKLDKAKKVIDWCSKLKIKTKGFFIIGHPDETIETIEKTINLACRLKLDDIVVTLNTPIPGSPQYNEVEKYGKLDETDWTKFNYWRPVFIPKSLNQDILLEKQKEMYRKFYLRPRVLLRYMLSFFSDGGLKRFLSVFKASLYLFQKEK